MPPADPNPAGDIDAPVDFFVSYAAADEGWATWITRTLEDAGHRVLVQVWDLVPGTNWTARIQHGLVCGARLLAVLTPAYLASVAAAAEWQAIWAADLAGRRRRLVPVRVERCDAASLGLLGSLTWIDLSEIEGPDDEAEARRRLLTGVRAASAGQVRPDQAPRFPDRRPGNRLGDGTSGDGTSGDGTSRPDDRYPGRPPTVWGLPAVLTRNSRFVGRAADLAGLRARLAGPDPGRSTPEPGDPEASAVAVHGMGGVGKTELAVEYAYRYAHAYDLVWWVRGKNPTLTVADLSSLAARLGLTERDGDAEAAAGAAVRALRTGQPHRRWLVIVDNAVAPTPTALVDEGGAGGIELDEFGPDDPAPGSATAEPDVPHRHLFRLLQAARATEHGHLLVTSRGPDWDDLARTVELAPFPRADSVRLLRRHRPRLVDPDADRLAAELGDLPLAVEQAGAWLSASGMTVAGYLNALRAETRQLLARGRPTRYPLIVAAAWNLALDRIGPDEPAVVELLTLAGFFGPEPIPLDLLPALAALAPAVDAEEAAPPEDGSPIRHLAKVCDSALCLGDTVARLRTLGLARVEEGTVTLHRLVQAVLRDRVPAGRRLELRAAVSWLMSRALEFDVQRNPRAWPRWAALLPHLQAQIEAGPTAVDADAVGLLMLANLAALYLRETGQLRAAVDLHSWVVTGTETVVGPDHRNTLACRNNLALALDLAGRSAEAIELYERILADSTRLLDPDDPNVGLARNNLASVYWAAGRITDAVGMFEQVVADAVRIIGPEHHDTLLARSNLATAYQAAGRLSEAVTWYEQVLDDAARTLGPDHLSVFLAQNNLAGAYQAGNRWTEARELYEQALAGRRRVLGEDHPDTLLSLGNLATVYALIGRVREAIETHERVLTATTGILGPDHPHVLSTRNNLACALEAAGRRPEALDSYERVLADRRRVLGPDHPDTLITQGNLASASRADGQHARSRGLYDDTLARAERVLGPDHPTTVRIRNDRAAAERDAGQRLNPARAVSPPGAPRRRPPAAGPA